MSLLDIFKKKEQQNEQLRLYQQEMMLDDEPDRCKCKQCNPPRPEAYRPNQVPIPKTAFSQ